MRRPLAPPGELSGGTWRPVSHTHEGVQVSPRQGLRDTLPQSPRRTDRDILTSPRQTARTKHKEQLQAEIFGSARRQTHMAPAPSNSMTQKEAAHQDSFGSPRTLRKAVQGPQSQAKMHGGAHLGSIQPWVEVQTTPRKVATAKPPPETLHGAVMLEAPAEQPSRMLSAGLMPNRPTSRNPEREASVPCDNLRGGVLLRGASEQQQQQNGASGVVPRLSIEEATRPGSSLCAMAAASSIAWSQGRSCSVSPRDANDIRDPAAVCHREVFGSARKGRASPREASLLRAGAAGIANLNVRRSCSAGADRRTMAHAELFGTRKLKKTPAQDNCLDLGAALAGPSLSARTRQSAAVKPGSGLFAPLPRTSCQDYSSWRSLVRLWDGWKLPPEQQEALRSFEQSASAREEEFQTSVEAQRLVDQIHLERDAVQAASKPSPRLQELRHQEKCLGRQKNYKEAGIRRDIANQVELEEKAAKAGEFFRRTGARRQAAAFQREAAAARQLQHELCEELWKIVYRGDLPQP